MATLIAAREVNSPVEPSSTVTPKTSREYLDEFIQLFLTGPALQDCLLHLCQSAPGEGLTPIVQTVITALNNPITLALTQVGIAPFRNSPELVIPYNLFNAKQSEFLVNLCLDETLSLDISSHASASNSFYVRLPLASCTIYLDKQDVLLNLMRLVCSSKTHTDQRMQSAIIKLLMQKLTTAIQIPSSVSVAVFQAIADETGIV